MHPLSSLNDEDIDEGVLICFGVDDCVGLEALVVLWQNIWLGHGRGGQQAWHWTTVVGRSRWGRGRRLETLTEGTWRSLWRADEEDLKQRKESTQRRRLRSCPKQCRPMTGQASCWSLRWAREEEEEEMWEKERIEGKRENKEIKEEKREEAAELLTWFLTQTSGR